MSKLTQQKFNLDLPITFEKRLRQLKQERIKAEQKELAQANSIPPNKRYERLVSAYRDIIKETMGVFNARPSSPGRGSSARIFEKDGQVFLTVHEPHGPTQELGLSPKTLSRIRRAFEKVGWTPQYFRL